MHDVIYGIFQPCHCVSKQILGSRTSWWHTKVYHVTIGPELEKRRKLSRGIDASFKVLTAALLKIQVLRTVTPCL
jgi:hypothetical protein